MTTIVSPDGLRARVEKASGGRQTVLYTAAGQASFMNVIPREDCAALGDGLGRGAHPAFIVGGRVCAELFYGSYPGVLKHGELLSQPGQAPASGIDFEAALQAARACGPGWHLSSNAERALLMLWCQRHGFAGHGNTDSGRCALAPEQCGVRLDGARPGDAGDNPATFGGSGPCSWRHDHSAHGIADLCGNLWEWQAGLRLVDGEIQIIPDNDAVHADLSATSGAWKAVRLTDGALLPPSAPGSAKYDAPRACLEGNAGAPLLSDVIRHRGGRRGDHRTTPGLMDARFGEIAGASPPTLLKQLGLAPAGRLDSDAQVYLRNYGERIFMSGGAWYSGLQGGLPALCLSHPRRHASSTVGARPAFIR